MSANYIPDDCFAYPEFKTQVNLPDSTSGISRSYLTYFFFGQFSVMVFFSALKSLWLGARAIPVAASHSFRVLAGMVSIPRGLVSPSLKNFIPRIISRSPREQMIGVAARRVIAFVANVKTLPDFPKGDCIGDSMGLVVSASDSYLAVSLARQHKAPGFFNQFELRKESRLVLFRQPRYRFCSHVTNSISFLISAFSVLNTPTMRDHYMPAELVDQGVLA